MPLQLRNTWDYQGAQQWRWEAFIDEVGGTGELSKVKSVRYTLHESFSPRSITVDDSAEGFRIESRGWGRFDLKAFVTFKDGSKQTLVHEIQLFEEPKKGTSPA